MIMHIRDIRDKQRLIIKSTDIVLFGPHERTVFELICLFQQLEYFRI